MQLSEQHGVQPRRPLYFIINRSWGETDWIVPLLVFFKQRGFSTFVLFVNSDVYRDGKKLNSALLAVLEEHTDRVVEPGKVLSRLPLRDRIQHARAAVRKAERDGKAGLAKLIHSLAPLLVPQRCSERHFKKGPLATSVCKYLQQQGFKKGSVFLDYSFISDANAKCTSYWELIRDISDGEVYVYPHGTIMNTASDGVVDHELRVWSKLGTAAWNGTFTYLSSTAELCESVNDGSDGRRNCLYVGTPRYQKWWRDWLMGRKRGHGLNRDRAITILLLIKYRREAEDAYTQMHTELLKVMQEEGCHVLVKPHPRIPMTLVHDWCDSVKALDYRIVDDPIMVSCMNGVDLVLTVPTSGLLDAVAMGVPVVEYYDYTKRELPEGNMYRGKSLEKPTTVFADEGLVVALSTVRDVRSFIGRVKQDPAILEETADAQRESFEKAIDTRICAGEIVSTHIDAQTKGYI